LRFEEAKVVIFLLIFVLLKSGFSWIIEVAETHSKLYSAVSSYKPFLIDVKSGYLRGVALSLGLKMVISSSSSSIPTKVKPKYDVFISFRGADTRNGFTSHLYSALRQKHIKAFLDDVCLQKGDEISSAIQKAVEESAISIVIFSENYASTTWNLDELVLILKCRKERGQIVLPIFYGIDPSYVRYQKETNAAAFVKHEKRFEMEKVQKWRQALRGATDLSGWDSRVMSESVLVEQVVEHVMRTLNSISPISMADLKGHITYWEKGELLGRGSFGSVYEAIADHGFFIAVKEVSLLDEGSRGKQSIDQLRQEIALLSQFEHENIVQYYGTSNDESKLYIFLELVSEGSLLSLYQKFILRDLQVSAYTRQILQGLKYLHDRNVIHRDIKCANILVHASGSVKLAEFGLAKVTKSNDVKSFQGTARWMAPEVVDPKQGYGLPADIWSLGCTVLEMLTREMPYSGLDWMQALFKIAKGEPPSVPDSLSNDARDFIQKCLQVSPDARATAAELLNHSFVNRPTPTYSGS
ncbi:hypothetical protein UlMin_043422, partial [Ulmus minor]